jgi:DNA repair exonuclease SbcCD ATPase subunit
MISVGAAVTCSIQWSVDGSEAKGRTMTNRAIKLTLRAFTGECEAAIANTRWDNVNAVEKSIERAGHQISRLNESNRVVIDGAVATLKFDELFLMCEYREKLKTEKDERAEAARASREEQKLLRDIEPAEEAEGRYQRRLAKANAEAVKAGGAKPEALTGQIKMREGDLADAHAKVERAQALAERTRSGYVYIISNVGSFGTTLLRSASRDGSIHWSVSAS